MMRSLETVNPFGLSQNGLKSSYWSVDETKYDPVLLFPVILFSGKASPLVTAIRISDPLIADIFTPLDAKGSFLKKFLKNSHHNVDHDGITRLLVALRPGNHNLEVIRESHEPEAFALG